MIGVNSGLSKSYNARSGLSHFAGSDGELVALVESCMRWEKPGLVPGTKRIPVPCERFFSGLVQVTDRIPLSAQWLSRGDQPYLSAFAVNTPKMPARYAEVVLAEREILGDQASTSEPLEIVAIGANPLPSPFESPTPVAMARNMLGKPDARPQDYTLKEFVESVIYWSRFVHSGPREESLSGPEYPPLLAAAITPEHGQPYVEVYARDLTFLPEPADPEPPRPMRLARCHMRLTPGRLGPYADPKLFAEAVWYWSSRPLRYAD